MARSRRKSFDREVIDRKIPVVDAQPAQSSQVATVAMARSGEGIPAEEFKEIALKGLAEGKDIVCDLGDLEYLEATALQVLLALDAEQKRQARSLVLTNASPELCRWFEYAGAAANFAIEQKCDA